MSSLSKPSIRYLFVTIRKDRRQRVLVIAAHSSDGHCRMDCAGGLAEEARQ